MNAFEYVLSCIQAREEDFEEKDADNYLIPDDKILIFSDAWACENIMKYHLNTSMLDRLFKDEWDGFIIGKSDVDNLKKTELHIDEEVKEWYSGVKYPYYRIRGRKISAELAQELAGGSKKIWEELKLIDFLNDFIFEDGTIGVNSTTTKYPHVVELFSDAIKLKNKIPGLDLFAAVTNWDSMPDEAWKEFLQPDADYEYGEYDKHTGRFTEYKDFEKNIEIGIWVHDNKIEILNPVNASAKYMEYIASESYEDKKRFAAKRYM